MRKSEKEVVISEVESKLKKALATIITDYRGLNVQELAELRQELGEQGIEYKIYKNTLAKRAADQAKFGDLSVFLSGPTAIAFGFEDPIAAAKLLSSFSKKHKALSIKGGFMEGRIVDAREIRVLANLPSREVLLGKLAGTLQGPISGLVNCLNGPLRGLATALGQIAEQKK